MKWILIGILTLASVEGYSQAERKFIRRGNRDYGDKKYQESEIQYRKALEKDPKSVPADYNLGNALYRQQQYDAAASRYTTLAENEKSNRELNRQFYNLGNALYQAGKYKESIEAYKNALRKTPGDLDAKHNLQLALRKLQEQDQKNSQDQNQDQKNRDQQQQDHQKNDQKQDQKNQQQQENNQPQQSQNQNAKGQISPEDAERILQALENEEKDVLRKVQEQQKQVKKVPVDKNW